MAHVAFGSLAPYSRDHVTLTTLEELGMKNRTLGGYRMRAHVLICRCASTWHLFSRALHTATTAPLLALVFAHPASGEWFVPSGSPVPGQATASAKTDGGASKSDTKAFCFEAALKPSPDEFISQRRTVTTECRILSKPGFHQCWINYGDFRELQPGVYEPRSACAYVHVRSRSGLGNNGKSSKVNGHFVGEKGTARPTAPDQSLRLDQTLSRRVAHVPGLYSTTFDPDNPIAMTVVVPIQSLVAMLRDNIAAALKTQSFGFAKLTKFEFAGYASGKPTFQLHFGIDSPILRCNPKVTFWIAHSTPADLVVQFGQVIPDCRDKGFLSGAMQLSEMISKAIADALADAAKDLIGEESDFKKWARKDPSWAELTAGAHLQGTYCATASGSQALCINLAYDHALFVRQYAAKYIDAAPRPQGPVNQDAVFAELARFRESAKQVMKDSTLHSGFRFPAAKDGKGGWRDRDAVIYNGLLCLSGEEVGCQAVARAQGPNGQWWRSPDLVATKPKGGDSFSGDQLNGVIAYLLQKENGAAYGRWLSFIKTQRAGLPTPQTPIDHGYRTCTDDQGMTCLLGGPDWYWLNALGPYLKVPSAIPAGEAAVETRYGFSPAMIYWQSVTAPGGYRLHLTGIQILLARRLGISAPELDQAAAVLAARQPANPFYLYLHLGKDRKVFDVTKTKCDIAAQQQLFEDWAWQNVESDEKWKSAMLWDCVFMYRLLS